MALQPTANTTDPLKLSEIKTEFSSVGQNNLRAYLGQGGAPGSGTLTVLDFLGRSATITRYSGGTVYGNLSTVNSSGTTGFGNPLYYDEIFGWFNNNGTAPSPSTLVDGKNISQWGNENRYTWVSGSTYTLTSSKSVFQLSGLGSSNPGSGFITGVKLGSSTLCTPTSYSFGGGVARWEFTGAGNLFSVGLSGTYTGYVYG